MDFQDLCNHLEENGCTIDHFEGDSHFVSNVITLKDVIIENLDDYSDVAIMHYCHVLGIPTPSNVDLNIDEYRNMINAVNRAAGEE